MADAPAPAPMIAVQCPACKQRMRARATMVGRNTTCPGCGGPFTVEVDTAAGSGPAAPPARTARPPSGAPRRASGVRRALPRSSANTGRNPVVIGAVAAAVVLAAVLGYVLFAGGGGGGGAETPEALFKQVQTAVVSQDGEALYNSIAPSERRKMEAQWKQQMDSPQGKMVMAMMATSLKMDPKKAQSMSARDFFVLIFSKMGEVNSADIAKIRDAEVVSTRYEGNRCFLRVRTGDKEEENAVVKEGGLWYLTGMNPLGSVQLKGST